MPRRRRLYRQTDFANRPLERTLAEYVDAERSGPAAQGFCKIRAGGLRIVAGTNAPAAPATRSKESRLETHP
ncbi:MAG: hypothetical protein DCC68_12230 [Planctomycetota bacterium]|nr:MAG: hypothetical protein DCC68_12230 [Planctomycetota bacterium]